MVGFTLDFSVKTYVFETAFLGLCFISIRLMILVFIFLANLSRTGTIPK